MLNGVIIILPINPTLFFVNEISNVELTSQKIKPTRRIRWPQIILRSKQMGVQARHQQKKQSRKEEHLLLIRHSIGRQKGKIRYVMFELSQFTIEMSSIGLTSGWSSVVFLFFSVPILVRHFTSRIL